MYNIFKICFTQTTFIITWWLFSCISSSFVYRVFSWDFLFLYNCYIAFEMGCQFSVFSPWFTGLMIYFLVFFDGSIEVAMHNFRCKFLMMEVCVCFCKPFAGDFRLFLIVFRIFAEVHHRLIWYYYKQNSKFGFFLCYGEDVALRL